MLLVVSDGRPYDLDYGQQYGDAAVLDYAVADTARALAEARDRGVRPYLVTVDPAGGDYLSEMCDPREYHVIADARDLPAALGQLVRGGPGRGAPGARAVPTALGPGLRARAGPRSWQLRRTRARPRSRRRCRSRGT